MVIGIAIAVNFFTNREERIENTIKLNKKIFSTEKLDITMETVLDRIADKVTELKRDLTEDERNDIISQCYKEKFDI